MASFEKAKKSYQKFHKERGQVRIHVMEEYTFWRENLMFVKVLSLNSSILLKNRRDLVTQYFCNIMHLG